METTSKAIVGISWKIEVAEMTTRQQEEEDLEHEEENREEDLQSVNCMKSPTSGSSIHPRLGEVRRGRQSIAGSKHNSLYHFW
ncbi:hypothetical protein B296_00051829 [Ensete ventricosum]|uniref:Uncharacterized protein n=1 Tax=Ensete ventricosum TaxID=4639 RepID=A0A426X788_ENSVE|nr:hypothetical protein B296_00051829 [Ensete ventricosum]